MNNTTAIVHDKEESTSSAVILFLSFSVLSACISKIVFSKLLKDRLPIPFTVSVLLLSFLIGIIVTQMKNAHNDFQNGEIQLSGIDPHLMYYIFLPLLIFDSSFNGHFHVIQQQLLSSILLAGPGVLLCTAIIALCAIYIFPYQWSWLVGLMFGSILSATDPVAVVAILHDSGASQSLASLIDCESLLNDGSAFVIFLIFHNIVIGEDHSAKKIIIDILKYTLGGPAFGLACGFLSVMILNRINNQLEVEITFTFGLAYLVFYIADVELGVSAVLALVTMGLYMNKYRYCISSNVQPIMSSAWRITTYFINILIFTVTGIVLAHSFIGTATSISSRDFGYSVLLYVAIHVGRVLPIVVLHPWMKWTGVNLSWKDCFVLSWSGLRGSMSLILVLIVSLDVRIDQVTRDRFLFHFSMIVLLTLIINGTTSQFFVKALGLNRGSRESEIVLVQALEHMRRQTSWKLNQMKEDEKFVDVDWKMLEDYLPEKLLEQSSSIIPEPTSSMDAPLPTIPIVIHRSESDRNDEVALPVLDPRNPSDEHEENIRQELILRFLTAMSIDYEKQWYLGMIRRKTLNILIKSVEEAKHRCSFELHWKSILEHFRLARSVHFLLGIDSFPCRINRWIEEIFFDHIYRTIELTLSYHSAKTRIDNIRFQFPELSNLNERIMNQLCAEVKLFQFQAEEILDDLKQSFLVCWKTQMTRRCAQMLLKYESVSIIQLYETGILDSKEYSHILQLIEKKLFTLEYGTIVHRQFLHVDPFDQLLLFQSFSPEEKLRWKSILHSTHLWFQPKILLIEKNQRVNTAYLILRGLVESVNDKRAIFYRSGSIIGIDCLFDGKALANECYSSAACLLEVYQIDFLLLNRLLANENIARLIYDQIAERRLSTKFREQFSFTSKQWRSLLTEKAIFYRTTSNLLIDLHLNHRLFLLSGRIFHEEIVFHSMQFHRITHSAVYQFDLSSIVYLWTLEDELALIEPACPSRSRRQSQGALYPNYLGDSIEFTPRRHSLSMTRPIDNLSHLQFIPAEIDANSETLSQHSFSNV